MKTVGKITRIEEGRSRPAWQVRCEPHVAIRLKRLFPRASKGTAGQIVVTDTAEMCRDLLWFAERYPMEIEGRDRMERQANGHAEREQLIFRMLADDYAPAEFNLALPLRSYQRVATEMLLHSNSLLLADEVGLGKTACAIGALTDRRTLPALIVTLTHLPRQWAAEINRFAPNLDVYIAKSTRPDEIVRKQKKTPLFRPDVFILNYHKLKGWEEYLDGMVKFVVFDEAQDLRRGESDKYRAARRIAASSQFRMALSATPIYNYGGEIYNVLDVISPDTLGTPSEFALEWCDSHLGARPKIKDPRAFGAYARESGLMLRRTRAEVGRELPSLTRIIHEIDSDLAEIDKVADAASELARIILTQHGLARMEKLRASEELSWKLRLATGVSKAKPVAEFVRMLVESGEKVLVFGWHHEVYGLLADRLKDLEPAFYTGNETMNQKQAALARFKDTSGAGTDVLVMSLRAGAGVDGLQGVCRTVVFAELDWSPGVHHQCVGRVHRDGQPDPVVAYFLVSDSGSDPVVSDILGLKRQQSDAIIDPDAPLIEQLEVDEGHIKRLAERFLEQRTGKSTGRCVEMEAPRRPEPLVQRAQS